MKTIPTQLENPKGLHQRYIVKKLVPNPNYDWGKASEIGENEEYFVENPERGAEYFVLRLDEGGKDVDHIRAGRIAIHAYAKAIRWKYPELAKDLEQRYPII